MPDISKINAVAVADIEKLDSILAANIEKVNGLTFATAPAFTPILDTYTNAAAAYSVRQLKSGVTVAMRVRRETAGGTGDDDEADVAFDTSFSTPTISLDSAISNASAGVTATTLGQFINVGTVNGTTYTNPDSLTVTASCFVDEWKDQSGNANHAEQTAQGSQPQIHDGTVNTDLILANGKPAVSSEAVDYSGFPISLGLSQPFTNFVVGKNNGVGSAFYYGFSPQMNAAFNSNIYAGSGLSTTVDLRNEAHIMWAVFNSSNSKLKSIKATQSQEVSGNAGTDTNFNYLLRRRSNDQGSNLVANELIFWDSEQSSTNLSGIETDINTYFSIY